MAVQTKGSWLAPERVPPLLRNWFATRETSTVRLQEKTDPTSDPHARYEVIYEAVFEPASLDQARVAIWLSSNGEVAIGLERFKRIAERLGVKGGKDRFAAGHEPHRVTESGLLLLLDLIADGKIAIEATVVPFLGLRLTKALVDRDLFESLVSKGYVPTNWLKPMNRAEFANKKEVLQFRRW